MSKQPPSLKSEHPLSLQEIFLAARELTDHEQRARYLIDVTGDDEQLRQRIERMLVSRQNSQSGPLARAVEQLVLTVADVGGQPKVDLSELPMIDSYKLLEQIGEGGMGSVYMAQQTAPVKRKVALKVIKAGMDSKEVIARFEAERQALAMMDHPHIAKVLDGGTTAQGCPYFVMELVRGVPITEFCDKQKLGLRERLELFIDVCRAVQHAHQKGIIHRDLKPSNLLVTMHDHQAVVKVIDFGVAKALNRELTERTLFTHFSQMIGTPLYMAPEQAQMSGLDIDTRSDIYSLGVLLYELLTGTIPFDRETMSKLGMDGIRKLLNEQEPQRPSFRISTLRAANQSTIVDNRRLDVPELSKQLRRELDWIVMKALEKDRERRYETANAFAADVERYLCDEPVLACPPRIAYQVQKYLKRHRALLATTSVILATLLVATATSLVFAFQANEARSIAEAQSDELLSAQQLAEQRLTQSRADFERAMKSLDMIVSEVSSPKFAQLPEGRRIRDKIIQQSLEHYQQIVNEHDNDPYARLQQAQAYLRLVRVQRATGQHREAVVAVDNAVTILNSLLVAEPENGAVQLQMVDTLHKRVYTEGIPPAEKLADAERALELMTRAIQSGKTEDFAHYANTHYLLAQVLHPNSPRAKALVEKCLMLCKEHGLPNHASAIIWQARRATGSKNYEQAEKLYREGINTNKSDAQLGDLWEQHNGPWHASMWELEYGELLERLGRHRDAEHQYRDAIAIATDLVLNYGEFHNYRMQLDRSVSTLLRLLAGQGRNGEISDVLEPIEQILGRTTALRMRADFYRSQAKYDLALTDTESIIELLGDQAEGEDYLQRAKLHTLVKEFDKAIDDYDQSVRLSKYPHWVLQDRSDFYVRYLQNHDQALVDLNSAIELAPAHGHLHKRRGAAHFYLAHYDLALADMTKALEFTPDDLSALDWIPPSLVAKCPNAAFRDGMLGLADRAIEQSDNAAIRMKRAVLLLARGELERAKVDLDKAVAWEPGNYALYQSALVALQLGEPSRYREICDRMLQEFQNSDNPTETHFAAWSCALASVAVDDYAQAIKLARRAVDREPDNQQYVNGLGAILFRAGEYTEAQTQLELALQIAESDNSSQAYTKLFLAMTLYRLGDEQAARQQLLLANQLASSELSDSPAWNHRLTLELLQSEAKALIGE